MLDWGSIFKQHLKDVSAIRFVVGSQPDQWGIPGEKQEDDKVMVQYLVNKFVEVRVEYILWAENEWVDAMVNLGHWWNMMNSTVQLYIIIQNSALKEVKKENFIDKMECVILFWRSLIKTMSGREKLRFRSHDPIWLRMRRISTLLGALHEMYQSRWILMDFGRDAWRARWNYSREQSLAFKTHQVGLYWLIMKINVVNLI